MNTVQNGAPPSEFFFFFFLCVELHVYTAPSSPYESCDVLRVGSTESGLRSKCCLVILGIEGGRLGAHAPALLDILSPLNQTARLLRCNVR